MARTVLHLVRVLEAPPALPEVSGVALRNFAGPQDVATWLELRRRAFQDEAFAVRDWGPPDFAAEFMSKPWWSPERLWFAETTTGGAASERTVGAVALALRGGARRPGDAGGAGGLPVVHWLMVLPEWRRRGVGRLLLAALEAACWAAGHRQIEVETHAAWTAAAAFYRSLGYR